MQRIPRTHLPEDERRLRSELAQLTTSVGFVRGSLSLRDRSCGKPGCHCARGEQMHKALYLVASTQGKYRQLYIPKKLIVTAEEWVEGYQRIRELLEQLSARQWDKLKRREP